MLLCNNHTYTLSLIFVDHWSVLHCQNFVISEVLYKWNHTVYDLRGFFFFLLRIIIPYKFKLLYISITFFFLLLSGVPPYVYTTCLTIYLLIDVWVVSSFSLLQKKLLWIFMYRFLCECKLSFILDKCPVQLLGHMALHVLFVRNCKLVSTSAVPLYFHEQCISDRFSPFLPAFCVVTIFLF